MFAILALFPIERTREEVKCVEQTFGSFLREKRMARGLTLRGMAAKLDLSPVYMSNIENDRRAAPSQEYLERMALLLQLDKPEREWMLDLAAKSKQNRVSADLPDYIMGSRDRPGCIAHSQGGGRHRPGVAGLYRPDQPAYENIRRGQ